MRTLKKLATNRRRLREIVVAALGFEPSELVSYLTKISDFHFFTKFGFVFLLSFNIKYGELIKPVLLLSDRSLIFFKNLITYVLVGNNLMLKMNLMLKIVKKI